MALALPLALALATLALALTLTLTYPSPNPNPSPTPSPKQELYQLDERPISFDELTADGYAGGAPMVRTAAVQRDEHMLAPWMARMEPLILVGTYPYP